MKFLRKLLSILLLVIVIVMICVAIYLAAGGAMASIPLLGTLIPELTASKAVGLAGLGLAAAYMVDEDTTSGYVSKVVNGAGDILEKSSEVIGSVFGGGISSFLNKTGLIRGLFVGLCGFLVLKGVLNGSKGKQEVKS